jgi:hypothetical protein
LVVVSLELLAPELGAALLPLALPDPLEESLEDGLLDEPELGVEDEDELELGELELGLGVEDELELELGELELGVLAEPDIEPDDEGVLLEPEDEDDGELGDVLEDDEPADDLSPERDAPGPPALSQPYRPLTATAMGITTKAVFFSKLIG